MALDKVIDSAVLDAGLTYPTGQATSDLLSRCGDNCVTHWGAGRCEALADGQSP